MPKRAFSTGISRRVLFTLEDGPLTTREVLAMIRRSAGINQGTIQTLLTRHVGYGLVSRADNKYELTKGGLRRIHWLKKNGYTLKDAAD